MIARSYARRRRTGGFLYAFAQLAWALHMPTLARAANIARGLNQMRD